MATGEVPKGAILVTADVVALYLSVPHSVGLDNLKKQYETYPNKKLSTEDIVKMTDFDLKKTCLSSILSFLNKYQEWLLERRLPLYMLVSL